MYIFKIFLAILAITLVESRASQGSNYKAKQPNDQDDNVKKPYVFGYEIQDKDGNKQHRHEQSDANGVRRGSYGYVDANGIYRKVHYIADSKGFRVLMTSNEPGLNNPDPLTKTGNKAPPPSGSHKKDANPSQNNLEGQYSELRKISSPTAYNTSAYQPKAYPSNTKVPEVPPRYHYPSPPPYDYKQEPQRNEGRRTYSDYISAQRDRRQPPPYAFGYDRTSPDQDYERDRSQDINYVDNRGPPVYKSYVQSSPLISVEPYLVPRVFYDDAATKASPVFYSDTKVNPLSAPMEGNQKPYYSVPYQESTASNYRLMEGQGAPEVSYADRVKQYEEPRAVTPSYYRDPLIRQVSAPKKKISLLFIDPKYAKYSDMESLPTITYASEYVPPTYKD